MLTTMVGSDHPAPACEFAAKMQCTLWARVADSEVLANSMVDWSKLPDLGAIALLTAAFAAVARHSKASVSGLWLTGWCMIALHFAALVFAPLNGFAGNFAEFVGLSALTWAGVLFLWASVPYRSHLSSRWMLAVLLGTNTLYLAVSILTPAPRWALTGSAILFGAAPLVLALLAARQVRHPLRWTTTALYCALSIFLLLFQNRPNDGQYLALNAIFFTVYLGCCLHFSYVYRRLAAGTFITSAGFFTWAAVFVVGPFMQSSFPSIHIQDEVWNLPKYVVAVGMILLVLEEQLEHNLHLALHDELTGLPNRRLFADRLELALERARRGGARAALLVLDLDRFKQVNDTFGHHIGDLALARSAQIFVGRVRRVDTVARTGGDEFSVILEDPVTREDAEHVGRTLAELLERPMVLEGHEIRVGASVGVAIFPEDGTTPEGLCIAADVCMYERKYGPGGRGFFHRQPSIFPERVEEAQSEAN